MALQLGAVLTAFRAANVPDDVAQRAAEELAGDENWFRDLDTRMGTGFTGVRLDFGKVDRRFSQLEAKIEQVSDRLDAKIEQVRLSTRSDISLLRWTVTLNLGLTLLMLGRLSGVIHG